MELLCPANSYASAVKVIAAGADSIYIGVDEKIFQSVSFTGRGKYNNNHEKILVDLDELVKITQYAHSLNKEVYYIANFPFLSGGKYNDKSLENYFLEYIDNGINANVDAIVIGDIGILSLLNKRNYSKKIHASCYFDTINKDQLLLMKEMGVSRVTLSYQATLEEIIELCQTNILEIEVFGYGGCAFFLNSCSFTHDFGETKCSDFIPGLTCKGEYFVECDGRVECSRILNVESGCGLCKIEELSNIGVKSLKITGRDINNDSIQNTVSLFRKFIDNTEKRMPLTIKKKDIPDWWKMYWCRNNRCKYNEKADNYKYIIGK